MSQPKQTYAGDDAVDIAVIGGGVNGLAIARDAAERGLRVTVVEREDIASGATSASSRLIHGGLKYLEQFDLKLVRESIRERHLLRLAAPHLVHDYPMLIPFYRGNRRPPALIRMGLAAFDLLSLGRRLGPSRKLNRAEALHVLPSLSREGLRGAAMYVDAQIPWAERLCVELMLDAERLGARVRTRTAVTELVREQDRVVGVRLRDAHSGRESVVRAGLTINAAGPWIDRVLHGQVDVPRLNGGTKGSHLVVDGFHGAPKVCVFFEAASDRRPIFVFPWEGRYILGSTDLTYDADLDDVRADQAEIAYLLEETNRTFPDAGLTPEHVLYTYSGVRPLPYTDGVTDNAKISRGHTVLNHAPRHPGLLTIIGGKLTTHRALAEEATDEAVRILGRGALPCRTRERPLPGAEATDWPAFRKEFLNASRLPVELSDELLTIYGVRAQKVADLASPAATTEPGGRHHNGSVPAAVVGAEVSLAVEEEMARTISDVLLRRMRHRLGSDMGLHLLPEVTRVMAGLLGWDDERTREETAAYRREIARYQPRASQATDPPGRVPHREEAE